MRCTTIRMMLFVVCMGLVPIFVGAAQEATLSIRYNGTFPKVELLVNNVKRGEIAQGKTVSLRLPANVSYQVTLRYGEIAETKTAWLASGLSRQLVFFGPNALVESESSTGSIIVHLAGSHDWANVFINDKAKGRVQQGKAQEIRVKSGETYKVTVTRGQARASVTVYIGVSGALSHKNVRLTL